MSAFFAFMLAGALAYIMEFIVLWYFSINHRILALALGYFLTIQTYAVAYFALSVAPPYWVIVVAGGIGYFGLLGLSLAYSYTRK